MELPTRILPLVALQSCVQENSHFRESFTALYHSSKTQNINSQKSHTLPIKHDCLGCSHSRNCWQAWWRTQNRDPCLFWRTGIIDVWIKLLSTLAKQCFGCSCYSVTCLLQDTTPAHQKRGKQELVWFQALTSSKGHHSVPFSTITVPYPSWSHHASGISPRSVVLNRKAKRFFFVTSRLDSWKSRQLEPTYTKSCTPSTTQQSCAVSQLNSTEKCLCKLEFSHPKGMTSSMDWRSKDLVHLWER